MSTPEHRGAKTRHILHSGDGIGTKTLEKIVLDAALDLAARWGTGPAQVVDPVAVVEFLAHDELHCQLQPNRLHRYVEIIACEAVADEARAAVRDAVIGNGLTLVDYPHPPRYPAGGPYSRIEKPQY